MSAEGTNVYFMSAEGTNEIYIFSLHEKLNVETSHIHDNSHIHVEISHVHDKHFNFLFTIYITFERRDANLAFARGSLTRSFVPWRHDVHVLFCLMTLDMTSETRIGV